MVKKKVYNNFMKSCIEKNIYCKYFSKTYEEARSKFRHNCKILKLEKKTIKIKCKYDNDLTIDIGILNGSKKKIFLHISGTHGAEAYAGSAIQIFLLERYAIHLSKNKSYNGPTIIFVHALNPYGMKYGRRFNEDNIDLNRNFCSKSLFKKLSSEEPSKIYSEMYNWLNPEKNRKTCKLTLNEKLEMLYYITKFGKTDIKQNVVGGQYHYPKGIFFGGNKLSQSHTLLSKYLKKRFSTKIEKLCILDVHTGIGPKGIDTLLCNTSKEFNLLNKITNHHKYIQIRDPKKSISYKIHGNVINSYSELLSSPGTKNLIAVQEFGTYKEIDVVLKVRSENSIYHYTKSKYKDSTLSKKLLNRKCKLRDVFCIYEDEWQNKIISRGVTLFNQFNNWIGSKEIL